jgi:hypothetical protein
MKSLPLIVDGFRVSANTTTTKAVAETTMRPATAFRHGADF